MSTKTIEKKINDLSAEVMQLRSILISALGKDHEGGYRPDFVKRILKNASEKPVARFTNAKGFLAQVKRS